MLKISLCGLCFSLFAVLFCADSMTKNHTRPPATDDRAAAQKLLQEGNYRDALEVFLKLARDPGNAGEQLVGDFQSIQLCYQNLQRIHELDDVREELITLHAKDWRFLQAAANSLIYDVHWGFMTAGEFYRGQGRGGGAWTDATERDRTRALQLFGQAAALIDGNAVESGSFWQAYASAILFNRGGSEAWRLQESTDLTTLPDYNVNEAGQFVYGRRAWGPNSGGKGAPVDAEGNPILYPVPQSWDAASNDGQRWRWCLEQSVKSNPTLRNAIDKQFADFLHSQFGVQTMANWGIILPRADDHAEGESDDSAANAFALHTLKDEETIAKLAIGVKRFNLPDDFNPIKIYRAIVARGGDFASDCSAQLAQIFEDRQQYPRAAEQWRETMAKFGKPELWQTRLDQIIKPWGRFENASTQAAGKGATIEYRFRNGKQVEFTAQPIDVDQLLKDIKVYLKSNPREFDWQKANFDSIGYDILMEQRLKYLLPEVARWKTDLSPRPSHFDSRVTITTPLQKAGAYLVRAQMVDGNESFIVLWVDDLAILRKPINGKYLYYVAEAASGSPVPKANVEFFGWQMQYNERKKGNDLLTRNFAETTDADGMLETDPGMMDVNYQWLTIARTADGRKAHLGFSGAWVSPYQQDGYGGTKIYGITDRPIYRPGQTLKYKFWLRETNYANDSGPVAVGQELMVKINDPQGNEILSRNVKVDPNGAVDGEFTLGSEAMLGNYGLRLTNNRDYQGFFNFQVEEYKKPEYEVTVDAPQEPVSLGETITAKVSAKYYFGGAVTNATVKYKVQRTPRDVRWFPVRRWDWLYGNGYWWFGSDYDWYPGFAKWGCYAPRWPWWGGMQEPPELVLDEETQIGPDGTVEIKIDTALAKALHGDQDHDYSITAEVVDSSRRTIVGSGTVTVARQAFRVYGWTDRGHYRIGDPIQATFVARTASGKGVAGKGKLKLLQVKYAADGQPAETEVQAWDVEVPASGEVTQALKASEPGQYRLSLVVDDGQGHVYEGGQMLVVMGQGFDGSAFRFNDLEIVAEKAEYAPGETVRLLVNTNRTESTVLLWLRPANGNYGVRPKVLRLTGKSTVVEVPVEKSDMPNFFIEATTVSEARVHSAIRNVIVPPEKRVVDVTLEPSQAKYTPGAEAKVRVKVTGPDGKPFVGSLVMTMYDRAIEYISGGSNVPEIREFFWKWVRSHYPQTETSLGRMFGNLYRPGAVAMSDLGVFGSSVADMELGGNVGGELRRDAGRSMKRAGGPPGGMALNGLAVGEAADAMPMAAPMEATAGGMGGYMSDNGIDGSGGAAPLAEATVRKDFADAAYWNANITTDADGTAEVSFKMPENLTDWKLRTWAMGPGTSVGEATASVVTAKNIMVRLQAPRFFVEKDEVVLSAIVHNYLEVAKTAKVGLQLSGGCLEPIEGSEKSLEIPAGGDVRVDWRVKAVREGEAVVTMSALTDVESDAVEMKFPVYVHGMLKTESFSGVVRRDEAGGKLEFTVPAERRAEQSRVEVRYSPTLAGAMVDALPYLVDYPYGCTEQTLNRFVPTVLTQNILKRMNLNLAEIKEKRTNLNAQEIGNDPERAKQWQRWASNPVFDQSEVDRMVKKGVADLTAMQCGDGGWGWFSGYGERSWPHTTAVVVHGLQVARANGVALVPDTLERGVQWLRQYQDEQVALLKEGERIMALPADKRPTNVRYRTVADNLDALVYNVLIDADVGNPDMANFLYRDRTKLSLYGMSLVGLAFDKQRDTERRDMLIRNIDQFVVYDAENQSAYIDLPNHGGYWWYWYGDTIEANAHYLKLLARTDVKNPKAAGLVKYLLNNRKHATYWNSTRDTAYCIEALADYLIASGEDKPNMTVEVWLDGELKQAVEITPQVLFQFNNAFVLNGEEIAAGKHTLEIRRKGEGPVYFNAYVTNFTLEDNITRAGLEVKVNRKFYKLVQREGAEASVEGSRGQALKQKVEKFDRVELASLSEVTSGDLIEIELEIDSKNDYEYVIFEDLKAAGCEAVDLQSGYASGGLGAYVEFRDERVSFFMRTLSQGKHSVSYRLRAEIPGQFSALPARAWAMYAPELKGNSDEMKLKIKD
ncbi:MAG: alpha-2-macroglobulin family protein [Planctomycetota bacterium]